MHLVEENLMRLAVLSRDVLPRSWIAPLGRFWGFLLYALLGSWRRKRLAQLQHAFPEKSPAEVRSLLKQVTRNGMTVLIEQLVATERSISESYDQVQGKEEAERVFRSLYERGKGLILVGMHLGNWEELVGMGSRHLLSKFDCEVNVVVTRMPTPYLNQLLIGIRKSVLKCGFIYVAQALYHVEKTLSRKGVVVFGLDVDGRQHGTFVPFLNRTISMGRGPAYFALKNDVPIAIFVQYRDADGVRRVSLEEVPFTPTGDTRRDGYDLTAQLASRIEGWIRKYPEQWFGWIQEPFRTRPIEEIEAGLKTNPKDVGLLVQAGDFCLARRRFKKAGEYFQRALDVDPLCYEAHVELGGLADQQGDTEKAMYHLFRAEELNAVDPRTLKHMGRFFLSRNLFKTGLRYYTRALRNRYDDPEAYWGRGQCLEKMGEMDEALKSYRRGLTINYDYGPLHLAMARVFATTGASNGNRGNLQAHLDAMRKLQVAPTREITEAVRQKEEQTPTQDTC